MRITRYKLLQGDNMKAKLKSYEPYHIGIKLKPYVDLDILREKIMTPLKEKGYKLTKIKTEMDLGPMGIITSAEIIGTKSEVNIQLNFPSKALNSIGTDPKKVLVVFEDVLESLSSIGYDIEETISFFEIMSNIIVEPKDNPIKILANSLKVTSKTLKSLGYSLPVCGIRLYEKKNEDNFIQTIIEPNPINPKKTFSLKLTYRSTNKEELKSIHENIERIVMDVTGSF